jgi:hypothetical protein
METIAIKNVKRGDYIKRKADALTVYVRGDYDRASKSYCCHAFDDISKSIYIKASKPVFVGFTF